MSRQEPFSIYKFLHVNVDVFNYQMGDNVHSFVLFVRIAPGKEVISPSHRLGLPLVFISHEYLEFFC